MKIWQGCRYAAAAGRPGSAVAEDTAVGEISEWQSPAHCQREPTGSGRWPPVAIQSASAALSAM